MNDAIPESWHIFMEQYPPFSKLQRKLGSSDWHVARGWVMFAGYYHAGIYAQMCSLGSLIDDRRAQF